MDSAGRTAVTALATIAAAIPLAVCVLIMSWDTAAPFAICLSVSIVWLVAMANIARD